jgi:hypothetical protein
MLKAHVIPPLRAEIKLLRDEKALAIAKGIVTLAMYLFSFFHEQGYSDYFDSYVFC